MKITLKSDGRFEHWWPLGNAPTNAIDIPKPDALELSQNPQTKKYDIATQTVINYIPPFVLVDAQNKKRVEIRTAFNNASTSNVTDNNGVDWDGGFESAIKLDAAKRLAETAQQTTVTLYDNSNTPHNLSIADTTGVVLLVANAYQIELAKRNDLYSQIDAASTQSELDLIAW